MTNKPNLNSSTKRQLLLGLTLYTALRHLKQITIEAASYLYQLSKLLITSLASIQLHITGVSPNTTITFSQKRQLKCHAAKHEI